MKCFKVSLHTTLEKDVECITVFIARIFVQISPCLEHFTSRIWTRGMSETMTHSRLRHVSSGVSLNRLDQ